MILNTLERLKSEKNPTRFVFSRVLWKTGLSSFFTIHRGDYKLKFYPTAVSATLYSDPNFNDDDQKLLRALLKPGDVFVDIGANIGHLSLLASTIVKSSGKVYSFEPHPRTYKYLTKNIDLNNFKNIKTYNCGLGEKSGSLNFTDTKSDDQNHVNEGSSQNNNITVNVHKLDDFLEIGKVKLLKVDTEGYEKFVFMGGLEFLKNVDYIYFETIEKNCGRFNYKTSEILDILAQQKFNFYEFREASFTPYKVGSKLPENLLACRTKPC